MKKVILSAIILFAATKLFCQVQTQTISFYNMSDRWSVCLSAGSVIFYGDIRDYDHTPFWKNQMEDKWGWGFRIKKQFTPVFAFSLNFVGGKFAGKREINNEYFKASMFAYDFGVKLDIIPIITRKDTNKFSLYGTLAMGLIDIRTIKRDLNNNYLYAYGYDESGEKLGNATTEMTIPIGLGIGYKIGKRFGINLEFKLYNIGSDKLDATLSNVNDKISYASLGLVYRFAVVNTQRTKPETTPERPSNFLF
ncbi:MAG: outer membrane beta-barrel protein [Bacteroidales bacterium]|nr:outer membrane beta-barrel protein [Bacteroidales bacterium]